MITLLGRKLPMNRFFNGKLLMVSLLLPFLTLLIPGDIFKIGFPIPFIIYDGTMADSIHSALDLFAWEHLKNSFIRLDYYVINVLAWYGFASLIAAVVRRLKTPQSHY